jgi:hypothetical protein
MRPIPTAKKPTVPYTQFKVLLSTTKKTITTKNKVASSFQSLRCVLVQDNIPP